jgi:hypothetical protein
MLKTLQRLLALGFLLIFGGYHVACVLQYRDLGLDWRPSEMVGKNVFWFARWKMFTGLSTYHTVPDFQGRSFEDSTQLMGEWTSLPMAEWYPARWESGYRWERPAAYNRSNVQVKFLELACERSGATQVRLVLRKWKATLGQREQPIKRYSEKALGVLPCDRKGPMAKGVRL